MHDAASFTAPRSPRATGRGAARTLIRHAAMALACAALGSAFSASAQTPPERAGANLDVLHYTARIEPDIAARTLRGEVAIRLAIRSGGAQSIEFDAGDLDIDAVREHGKALGFEKIDKRVRIRLPAPAVAGERREIDI
ncbi:MAG: hypothetical protein JF591_23270, partial [Lysobacter sp.]|nr:hypothetical protein [Lysobacter sp.]